MATKPNLALILAILTSACATQGTVETNTVSQFSPMRIAQRTVQEPDTDVTTGTVSSRQYLVNPAEYPALSPLERVRWVKGIDEKTSRVQWPSQRITTLDTKAALSPVPVEEVFFEIIDGKLSADAVAKKSHFVGNASRYIVEFIHAKGADVDSSYTLVQTWNDLAQELKEKGLDPTKVIISGDQYNKGREGILLIKLGSHDAS